MPTANGLITRELYNSVKTTQRRLAEFVAKLDSMEYCGIDCTAQRADAASVMEQLMRLEERFMNPPPS